MENPFRYNGQFTDDETGFIYLRSRFYDPSVGRFTSEDGARDGMNWYVYCGNNAVNRIDFSGNNWVDDIQNFFGGLKERSNAMSREIYRNVWRTGA